MFSDEWSKYKSWSKLKKQMNDLLCETLKTRVAYFYTRYHKDRGSYGRATINFDKKELVAFSWDIGYGVQWHDEYDEYMKNEDCTQKDIHDRLMQKKWMPDGTLCHQDFLQAVTEYLNTDVFSALYSDNYLLRIFAYMDRRIGKRTLLKIKDEVSALPEWVKQFYSIRCEAEQI